MIGLRRHLALAVAGLLLALAWTAPVRAQQASPHAIEIPAWFTLSLLDFKDEVQAAARAGKRLMLYFGQDGCPYCKELMQANFSQRDIVDKTRAHFLAIELNIWGDRDVTWVDGRSMSEKELARALKVQFTPTLLFLHTDGRIAARLNGLYPPQRFSAALDYLIGGHDAHMSLGDYLAGHARDAARPELAEEPFYLKPPYDLRRQPGAKPLAVLFETRHCKPCDEMHQEAFQRAEFKALRPRFDIVRFGLGDAVELITPQGQRMRADAWARELKVAYTPSVVFFDASQREVFRFEGYVRPFHLTGSFDYVASGAYRKQPEFQRFLQDKAERARVRGQPVELWR